MPPSGAIARRAYLKYLGAGMLAAGAAGAAWYLYGAFPRSQITETSATTSETSIRSSLTPRTTPSGNLYDAPDPKRVETDVTVAAYYLTSWGEKTVYAKGRSEDLSIGTNFHPMLRPYEVNSSGTYDSGDPKVADWHIKWALEHGISVLVPFWMWPEGSWEKKFEQGFLKSKYLSLIRFAMNYSYIDPTYMAPTDNTRKAFDYIAQHYFPHPSYFRFVNRPVVFFYQAHICANSLGLQTLEMLTNLMRTTASQHGYDIFLVGDVMNNDWYPSMNKDLPKFFDAVTSYNMPDAGSTTIQNRTYHGKTAKYFCIAPYDRMVDGYVSLTGKWQSYARNSGSRIIPPLCPGFNNSLLFDLGFDDWIFQRTNPSPESFAEMCRRAEPYVDPDLNLVVMEGWNEIHEESILEPMSEIGFDYADAVRDTFGLGDRSSWPPNVYPTKDGIREYV